MASTNQSALITDVVDVTPAWLTQTLRRTGTLDQGYVTAMAFDEQRTTSFSTVVRLHITYSHETQAPPHLFLKFSRPTRSVSVPEHGWEVKFYTDLAPAMLHGPVVRCYDAMFSPELGRLHLLLEDLSETHYPEPPSHLPPTFPQCQQIVDALAHLHSYWWERPPFALSGQQVPDEAEIYARVQENAQRATAFQAMLGDRLSNARPCNLPRCACGPTQTVPTPHIYPRDECRAR